VYRELRHPAAPADVQRWIAEPPHCLEVRSVAITEKVSDLDIGEAPAILLAEQLGAAALLLMDDAKGRREAAHRGIPSTGTLGVLQAASKRSFLLLRDTLPRLLETNFYIAPPLIESLLAEERSRIEQN
jgi:predicted nucleic acid-binding protein